MKTKLLLALTPILLTACKSTASSTQASSTPAADPEVAALIDEAPVEVRAAPVPPVALGVPPAVRPGSFQDDLDFLREHVRTIVLSDERGGRIALVPAYQGRVMTSTATGENGLSLGWINRELICADPQPAPFHAYGGEDRLWIGPEGGQFSLFFEPGAQFQRAAWRVPAPIDSEPFDVVEKEQDRAVFRKRFQLQNYSGTKFDLEVTREVRLRDPAQTLAAMRVELPKELSAVAFESVNTITNVGTTAWKKDTGLLSVWILGAFETSPTATVVVPFETGPKSVLGPIVNEEYLGQLPADRLAVDEAHGTILFKADGQLRSQIGIGPRRARKVLGSWDEESSVLTLVEYTLPPRDVQEYVNSQWRVQENPYDGDTLYISTDGPATPGGTGQGNYYELETSSPALTLGPGSRATHVHRTLHLQGPRESLAVVAKQVLGVSLNDLGKPARP